jgi:uncharacterized membrane protein (UPF0182 family)
MGSRSRIIWGFIIAAAVVFALLRSAATVYFNKLWFQSLGDGAVFWRVITARLLVGGIAGLATLAFVFGNLALTRADLREAVIADERWLRGRRLTGILAAVSAVLALLTGWAASGQWPVFFRYLDQVPFGIADPVFHRDVAFYVFTLPMLRQLFSFGVVLLLLGGLGTLALYALSGEVGIQHERLVVHPRARAHLAVLAGLALLLKAWAYILDAYALLNSTRGVVVGASYADLHASLPAYHILAVAAVLAAGIAFANAFGNRMRVLALAVGGLFVLSIAVGTAYPALVEEFAVRPSELQREAPYIAQNIAFTRRAYNLDLIHSQSFAPKLDLSAADLARASDTVQNMRLWSESVALTDFQQEQSLRSYYSFDPVTVDRYVVQGHERQVLLSAREIDYASLAEPTWVNEHLKYTHGYGAVMVSATSADTAGLPSYWIKNVPPTSPVGIALSRPQIYYGVSNAPYAIVDTATREFDYPSGQQDVYADYSAATGGVPIGPLLNRAAFALREDNYDIVLSSDIQARSRALVYRNVLSRVQAIAPYLQYEGSPYLVVANGGLDWIVDAYTESSTFPYSETAPGQSFNYIRNSVKVVVNAYTGQTTFYVIDATDPIIRTYARIFPGLYQPLSAMPASLRAHLRYPQGIFQVQMEMYATYHMTDPTVFYNREDLWTPANEIVGNQQQAARPYYIIVQLPGSSTAEFLLMEPFTPYQHDNMIAWVAARSDGANYGQMVAYEFPKGQLTFGPLQIDAEINQDPAIAQDLTLWSHQGSNVLRGRLLAIPVQNALLYVEPIYQEGSGAGLPQLRRVIIAYGSQIGFQPSLQGALSSVFGSGPAASPPPAAATGPAQSALAAYQQALAALKTGNFAAFAKAWSEVGTLLQRVGGK